MLVSDRFQQKQQTKTAELIDQSLTLSDTANKTIIGVEKVSQKVTDMVDRGSALDKVSNLGDFSCSLPSHRAIAAVLDLLEQNASSKRDIQTL